MLSSNLFFIVSLRLKRIKLCILQRIFENIDFIFFDYFIDEFTNFNRLYIYFNLGNSTIKKYIKYKMKEYDIYDLRIYNARV